MTVVGFNLTKISIERKDVISGKIQVNSKADVTNIKKESIKITEGKDVIRADFSFEINYEPDFAKVHFKGYVLLLEEPKKAKQIIKDWKKKKVESEVKEEIFNMVLRKCNIKAFSLEDDLNLPTHFPFPKVKAESRT